MSDTPNLDELKNLAKLLSDLLAKPDPGLFTWRTAVSNTCAKIAEFA